MFNISGSEVIIILLLALVVLGPDKLPDFMRRVGRTWAELRKLSSGFQDEVRRGFEEPVRELNKTARSVSKAATFDTDGKRKANTTTKRAADTAAARGRARRDGTTADGTTADAESAAPAAETEAPDADPAVVEAANVDPADVDPADVEFADVERADVDAADTAR